jgi:hypothetical protein
MLRADERLGELEKKAIAANAKAFRESLRPAKDWP